MERLCSVSPKSTLCGDEIYFKRYLDDCCDRNVVTLDIGEPWGSESAGARQLIRISNTSEQAVDNITFDKDKAWAKILKIPPSPIPGLHVSSTQYAIIGDVSPTGKADTSPRFRVSRDPGNPFDWPLWQRIYHTAIPSLLASWVSFGSSVYATGAMEVANEFDISLAVALLGISLYVLGLAFGPMLAAPISEISGRMAVYRLSILLTVAFTLGSGFSPNMVSLAFCRFFAGFFGSPCLAVGAGTIADLWRPVTRATALTIYLLALFLGAALGPLAGGFLTQHKGWRWTQWTMLMVLAMCGPASLFMKETYVKVIQQKRVKGESNESGKPSGTTGPSAMKSIVNMTLIRPAYMLFTEPNVAFLSIYSGFNFAILYSYFETFPRVFGEIYHFGLDSVGLTFLGIVVGCILATISTLIIDGCVYRREYRKSFKKGRNGIVAPEHRLYAAMLGGFGIPIGLFWFAWTARREIHWISPILASLPFGWGSLMLFTANVLYNMDVYGSTSGASAAAASGLVHYVLSAVLPWFTVQMYRKLGVPWATSLLGFVSLLMLPMPWVLFRYGHRIRSNSHYATAN